VKNVWIGVNFPLSTVIFKGGFVGQTHPRFLYIQGNSEISLEKKPEEVIDKKFSHKSFFRFRDTND
jgi:hypothetical protein